MSDTGKIVVSGQAVFAEDTYIWPSAEEGAFIPSFYEIVSADEVSLVSKT